MCIRDRYQRRVHGYGLFENAIFGGRIDNEYDMKVLRAYLKSYFSKKVLSGDQQLPTGLPIPQSKAIKDYSLFINKMNEQDIPSYFGLPMNIDKAVQRYNSQKILESLKILMSVRGEELKFDREKWGLLLRPVIMLWKALYDNKLKSLTSGAARNAKLEKSQDPLESFIYSEFISCQQMIEKVNQSIQGFNEVFFNNGLLTSEIQDHALNILMGNVPVKWISFWEGPLNPQAWLKGFSFRCVQVKKWLDQLQHNELMNSELTLSDLFHPEVFLNAIRQKTAKIKKIPIDDMKLICSLEQEKIQGNNRIIFMIKGLLLQGAGFDSQNKRLIDPANNMPEFMQLPICYCAWVGEADSEPYPINQLGTFPLFLNGFREKLLTSIKIPNSGANFDDRITSGVAFFLSEID
eukprot:TRINITY_DN2149_c0_g1_i7.p1 TRINITY_DN2149_c0_g1~~TRINITY_DN2149_c0_g1_i7.p1  ORF type:complete len:406 (+),score=66.21 TRINITY_DN2149_c0_g1_i7:148-1365(+)